MFVFNARFHSRKPISLSFLNPGPSQREFDPSGSAHQTRVQAKQSNIIITTVLHSVIVAVYLHLNRSKSHIELFTYLTVAHFKVVSSPAEV